MKKSNFTVKNEKTLNHLYIVWIFTMMVFLFFMYFISIGHEYQGKTVLELLSR
jgi:hypothetical protein